MAVSELSDAAITLTILGDGVERKSMTKQIARLGLSSRISMPGIVADQAMRNYYDDADAFVMPSVETPDGDSDGLPNALLEAAAFGIPIIGTNAGSLSDLLNDESGIIIDRTIDAARVSRDIALAIRDVMINPDKAAARALRMRQFVEERYDNRRNIEPLFNELSIP